MVVWLKLSRSLYDTSSSEARPRAEMKGSTALQARTYLPTPGTHPTTAAVSEVKLSGRFFFFFVLSVFLDFSLFFLFVACRRGVRLYHPMIHQHPPTRPSAGLEDCRIFPPKLRNLDYFVPQNGQKNGCSSKRGYYGTF